MTVQELLVALSKCDPNASVICTALTNEGKLKMGYPLAVEEPKPPPGTPAPKRAQDKQVFLTIRW